MRRWESDGAGNWHLYEGERSMRLLARLTTADGGGWAIWIGGELVAVTDRTGVDSARDAAMHHADKLIEERERIRKGA